MNDHPNWCEGLYEAKSAELVLYGRALGLTHAEAEDVLQEVFMALLKREQAPAQPEHYCLRTYRNRALNYRRNLWRRLARELESHRWFERSPDVTTAELDAMRLLISLPQEQREVLVLKIWHRYTFEEIGQLVGISANTAAGRYRYGLGKLKATLKGEKYERHERFGEDFGLLGTTPPLG